jgi:hypothetical protein
VLVVRGRGDATPPTLDFGVGIVLDETGGVQRVAPHGDVRQILAG